MSQSERDLSAVSVEDFESLNYSDRCRLFEDDPDRYARLTDQAHESRRTQ